MLRSMTAYGRFALRTSIGYYTIEISSINKKFLEINVQLPPELNRFMGDIKKWISSVIQRGQLTVKITAQFDNTTPLVVKPNLSLARQLKQAWDAITHDLQLPSSSFSLDLIADQDQLFTYESNLQDIDLYTQTLKGLVDGCLISLLEMKKKEGAELQRDTSSRLALLHTLIDDIAKQSPETTLRQQEKLKQRLQAAVPGCVDNDDRILREICLIADKVDITEEVLRFSSHLQQFEEIIHSEESCKGKTLEFLIQELNREVNTIGSKASELAITRHVVTIKGELEKIREQLQNVE